ncbi:MAG: TetR/AcrR family transcriptional regulator [Sandaracinaceae bacterium]
MARQKKRPLARPEPPSATRSDSKAIVEAILTAGEELAARGLGEVTVAAIATRAGVGTASVHRYFPDKGALFAELFRRQHARVLDGLERALAESTTLEDAARRCTESFAGFDEEEARLRRALNTDVPLSWSLDELAPVLDGSIDTIVEGIRRYLPDVPDAVLRERVFYVVGLGRGIVMLRLLRPERAPSTESSVDFITAQTLRVLDPPE